MTQKEAMAELRRLVKEECTCGCEAAEIRVACHTRCPYRMAAFLRPELRPYIGPLYRVELPTAA